ncbi:hypothetical protein [Acidicapsa acidisoli]|uniref:hypothetical protein n=1 Tax=Acidicapsa acidisoli TaxID=1615681 RepID=UPI0021E01F55|nr:hypothetical protein [Acidicapsa acidisoli]
MPTQNEHPEGRAIATVATNGVSTIPWWIRIAVCLGALLTGAGAVIALVNPAMLVSPQDAINGAVHIYAGYLASRNFALAILLLALLGLGAKRALGNLMAFVALVQFFDAGMDCIEGRWTIAPGVLVFGLVFLAGAAKLSGYPLWKRESWER